MRPCLVALSIAVLLPAGCSATDAGSVLDRIAPPVPSPSPSPAMSASPPAPDSAPPAAAATIPTDRATVTRVIDGDTAEMRLASGAIERVRFIGVDTPESTTRHEPYGAEASRFTKARLDGAPVHLEYDVERRDRYGRLLAYVWMRPPRDGSPADVRAAMFNATLLVEGYAQTATFPPNVRYVEAFRALQAEAREANRGLWRL